MTIWTKVNHGRKFFPLNLRVVIWRDAEKRSEAETIKAIAEMDWFSLKDISELPEVVPIGPVNALLFILLNYFALSDTMYTK